MDERLLSGNPAEKVGAAAREAVPGGRILRVEIGSDGSPYEAHVRRSDGTDVTVRVDEDFEVTGIEVGFGSPRGSMDESA